MAANQTAALPVCVAKRTVRASATCDLDTGVCFRLWDKSESSIF